MTQKDILVFAVIMPTSQEHQTSLISGQIKAEPGLGLHSLVTGFIPANGIHSSSRDISGCFSKS
jgi:hypothetical protein